MNADPLSEPVWMSTWVSPNHGPQLVAQDFTAFLGARLDEDERFACDASSHLRTWEVRGLDVYATGGSPSLNPVARYAFGKVGEHIARFDPQRTLAEVKAKREIVTDFEAYSAAPDRLTNPWTLPYWMALRKMMYALAEVYRDHPDYAAAIEAMRNTV